MDTPEVDSTESKKPDPAEKPSTERAPSFAIWGVAMIAIAVGLGVSAALLVDYSRPAPTFCGDGGGCSALRLSKLAYPFGIPMPAFGVLGFLGHAIVWNLTFSRARLFRLVWSTGAGAIALALLMVQFRQSTYCPLCMATDISGAILLLLAAGGTPKPPSSLVARAGAGLAVAFLGFAVAAFGFSRPMRLAPVGPVPPAIVEELGRAGRGAIPIIDFADFECPFCRINHASLTEAIAKVGSPVNVVRKHVPLDRIHPLAHGMALVAICAEELGKGEVVADALFTATESSESHPLDGCTLDGCKKIAIAKGIDEAKLIACLASAKTEERIKRDSDLFNATKGERDGLPLLWIGTHKLVGAQPPAMLEAAIRSAAKGE